MNDRYRTMFVPPMPAGGHTPAESEQTMRTHMKRIIDGKSYDTETATCIADNEFWDGHNYERGGTNCHLYRTKKGRFFVVHSTQWQGSRARLDVLSEQQARQLYESLPESNVAYEEAFPGSVVEEA